MGGAVILAGDVGGTKTYLAFFDTLEHGFKPLAQVRYSTADFADLGTLLATFVKEVGYRPARVVLGVPGAVRQVPVQAVNLPWTIDPADLRRALDLEAVHLLNDLQATSYGTQVLQSEDVVVLNEGGTDAEGNVAVIAAGTGLGEGGLCWSGERYVAIASEGGHADFAPANALQAELWDYLHERFGHVSWERLVSGPGLAHLYDFLRDSGRGGEQEWLRQELQQGDRSDAISRAALQERCPLAVAALDLFIDLYGAETGNLALKLIATGGVFVGGGIAPKILARLRQGRFMEAFLAKGRMREVLREVPVKVVINDKTGLMGAAYWGSQLEKG
jgi:glucokinase